MVITFKFGKGFTGFFNPIAEATNACGSYLLESAEEIYIKNCNSLTSQNRAMQSDESKFYSIYPNPASEIVNVAILDADRRPVSAAKVLAILYDFNGVQKKQVEIINNNAAINVADLPEGIYILKINVDGIEETHQIIVN